jgi:large subunit ribosomal protein L19
MNKLIAKIESEQTTNKFDFNVGDNIKVHTKVKEGEKSRIQIYQGIVMDKAGSGINANFTVRRISYGEGVERVFPIHSPSIAKIEVEKKGKVRQSNIFYLRGRTGSAAMDVARATEASEEAKA